MSRLEIAPSAAWAIEPARLLRPEGLAFSRCARWLAVAEARGNRVSIHRVPDGGSGAPERVQEIVGEAQGIGYPHDADFSPDGRVLVVANRGANTLTFYEREAGDEGAFVPRPAWTIAGPVSKLRNPGGVKFVPPDGRVVAAANLMGDSVTFYRRRDGGGPRYETTPWRRLRGPHTRISGPDGLAFTRDGRLLAVTNHDANTVSVFAWSAWRRAFRARPVAVLEGESAGLRCPHSLSFSPGTRHLAVSNAGGRAVSVFAYEGGRRPRWTPQPFTTLTASVPGAFEARNAENVEEGGSKGVAFSSRGLGVSNEHFGLRFHPVEFASASPAAPPVGSGAGR